MSGDYMPFIVFLLTNIVMLVKCHGIPLFNIFMGRDVPTPYPVSYSANHPQSYPCYHNNKCEDYPLTTPYENFVNTNMGNFEKSSQLHNFNHQSKPGLYTGVNSVLSSAQAMLGGLPRLTSPLGVLNFLPLHGWPVDNHYPIQYSGNTNKKSYSIPENLYNNHGNNEPSRRHFNVLKDTNYRIPLLHLNSLVNKHKYTQSKTTTTTLKMESTTMAKDNTEVDVYCNLSLATHFLEGLDRFERTFYMITFKKLVSISPDDRRENGLSFVQSALFLEMALLAISTVVDANTKGEIERSIGFRHSDTDKTSIIRKIVTSLPNSTDELKFYRSSRLVMGQGREVNAAFSSAAATALPLSIDTLNATNTPAGIASTLNSMVEMDSGGAIRDTFEESEVSDGVEDVLITTLYMRARWRSAPTLLNGTYPFRESEAAPKRTVRMMRINDIMRYVHLKEWDAEALEIYYSTSGLSLLMLVPRGCSLRRLSEHVASAPSLPSIASRMRTIRVAATLPLYTLRMTLLLRDKLEAMGISHLMDVKEKSQNRTLRISHAVQRLMFWAEAGRNAFKDDGIDWDPPPELTIVVDRPYIFFVRWRNITLLNGHFVL